jgi:hypothetical protein
MAARRAHTSQSPGGPRIETELSYLLLFCSCRWDVEVYLLLYAGRMRVCNLPHRALAIRGLWIESPLALFTWRLESSFFTSWCWDFLLWISFLGQASATGSVSVSCFNFWLMPLLLPPSSIFMQTTVNNIRREIRIWVLVAVVSVIRLHQLV